MGGVYTLLKLDALALETIPLRPAPSGDLGIDE